MTEHEHSDSQRSNWDMREGGVGALLRRARERRNLSEQDLARTLRLEPRIVQLLEANEFDQLPAPAFARGYLRAMAKELLLDPEPLLAMFEARGGHALPPLTDFVSRAPLQITSDSRLVRYTTWLLALVMLVLVALWWRGHRDRFSMLDYMQQNHEADIEQLAATPPLPYTFEIVTHPDDPFYRAEDPPSAALTADDAAAAGEEITLSAHGEAWVEITDARGERLYYNLIKPGNEVHVQGRRPYTLVIGNAPAVALSFAGHAVDLLSIANEGVARLQLGGDATPPQESALDEH